MKLLKRLIKIKIMMKGEIIGLYDFGQDEHNEVLDMIISLKID